MFTASSAAIKGSKSLIKKNAFKLEKTQTDNDVVLTFNPYMSSDLLRPLLLRCPLRQRTEHLSQPAAADSGIPGHERQQRLVAGRSRRPARLCAFQLHPQIRIHMNQRMIPETVFGPEEGCEQSEQKETTIRTRCDLFLICFHGVW